VRICGQITNVLSGTNRHGSATKSYTNAILYKHRRYPHE